MSSTKHSGDRSVAAEVAIIARHVVGAELPLAIRGWDGSRHGPPDARVTLELHGPRALQQLIWAPGELGLARAHVAGDLDIDGNVFDLLGLRDELAGRDQPFDLSIRPAGWLAAFKAMRRLGVSFDRPEVPPEEAHVRGWLHSRRRDARAVRHHYDVGNDFYQLLLGPSLTYSCAYWNRPDITLEAAQEAKHELICRKLGLRPGMRLLDVGCGWGSMALHAARHHGAVVTAVTLSQEQAELARERVSDEGLSDQVDVRVQDYRDITDDPFDAISSIGMFEHVGMEQMSVYLDRLRTHLVPGGRLLNHAISRPDPTQNPSVARRSFMARYVFPDAALIEVGHLVTAMQATGLEVRDVHSLREHYARTLRSWVSNLEDRWEDAQQMVGPGRARVWRLYLAGSALGFEHGRLAVHQVLAVRNNADGSNSVPASREDFEPTARVRQSSSS